MDPSNFHLPPLHEAQPILSKPLPVPSIKLFKEEKSKLIDSIPLEDTESISNQTFASLISEAFAQHKGFIIARI